MSGGKRWYVQGIYHHEPPYSLLRLSACIATLSFYIISYTKDTKVIAMDFTIPIFFYIPQIIRRESVLFSFIYLGLI